MIQKSAFLGSGIAVFLTSPFFLAEEDLFKAPELKATVSVATSNLAAVFTIRCASRGDTDTGAVRRSVATPLGNADFGRGLLTLSYTLVLNANTQIKTIYNTLFGMLVLRVFSQKEVDQKVL